MNLRTMSFVGRAWFGVCLTVPAFDGGAGEVPVNRDIEAHLVTAALQVSEEPNELAKVADVGPQRRPNDGHRRRSIEEVVVTASKREERLQDVPISITAVTADDIDRRGLVNAEDYLRGIPGANQVEGAFGQAVVIRGIETSSGAQNFGSGTTAATYFGETPTTNSAGLNGGTNVDIKLVDIERVEVLRGPQGTAFGNSAMGGAVRTIPVAPKLDGFEGKVAAGYSATSGTGGDNHNLQAVGNLPLIKDKLAIRATAYQYQDSGFYRSRAGSDAAFQSAVVTPYGVQAFATDEEEVGDYYAIGGRIAALFQVSDDLQFTVSYLSQKTERDGFALADSGSYEQTILQVAPEHVIRGQHRGLFDTDIDLANVVMEYNLGWANLLATYSDTRGGSTGSVPWTSFAVDLPASEKGKSSHHGKVAEIRLTTQRDGPWNFLAGLYGEELDDDVFYAYSWYGLPEINFFAPGERSMGTVRDKRNLKQKAAFGEVSWEFLPNWSLTAGLRAYDYERSNRGAGSGPFGGFGDGTLGPALNGDASGESFRGNLSYKPSENTHLYASWSEGFRLGQPQSTGLEGVCDSDGNGIVDGTSIPTESTKGTKADDVDSYEIGGKFALLDRRLAISADIFRMEWSGMPVFLRAGTFETGCGFGFLANAGEALSEGVELQVNYQITESFRVDLGGSWIDARLTADVPLAGLSDGNKLPAPKSNASLGLQYEFEIGTYNAFVRTDSIYVGSFNGDILQSPNTKSGDYIKLDASARVEIRNLSIDLFVRNLTNEDAFTFRGAGGGEFFGFRLRPRTIGLQLGYNF